MLTDFSGSVPSTPLGFEVQPNPQVPAQFEIISVNASQPLSPEDGLSAFIFRVQHAEDTFYILQVFSIRKIDSCLPTFTRDYSIVSKHRIRGGPTAFFYLQSSLTDALDLSYFSCQEVNISLAVVNRNGSSQFTSPNPVCVHGGVFIYSTM